MTDPLSLTRAQSIEAFGWEAVPRDPAALLKTATSSSPATINSLDELIKDYDFAEVVAQTEEWVTERLPIETLNHSMRVFYFGIAIAKQRFPDWLSSTFVETYFLASLLHDIGTTPTNMAATLLSFEFQGGICALQLLQSFGAPKAQAESVCETIIRHQDLGTTGTVTRLTALILLTTLLDNAGMNHETPILGGGGLVTREAIEVVVQRYPRKGWTGCFANTVEREKEQKPWCHSTHIEGFEGKVRANKLMAEWDETS